jgi:transposase-like protein
MRNFITKMGRRRSKPYLSMLKDVFSAPTKEDARFRKNRLIEQLEDKHSNVAVWLDDTIEACFSVYELPAGHYRRMKSTNMIERFNQELKRRRRRMVARCTGNHRLYAPVWDTRYQGGGTNRLSNQLGRSGAS